MVSALRVLYVEVFSSINFCLHKKLVLIESFSKLSKFCSKIDGHEITALECNLTKRKHKYLHKTKYCWLTLSTRSDSRFNVKFLGIFEQKFSEFN